MYTSSKWWSGPVAISRARLVSAMPISAPVTHDMSLNAHLLDQDMVLDSF